MAIKWDYQQNLKSKEHKIFLQLSKSITKKPRKATMDTEKKMCRGDVYRNDEDRNKEENG